MFQELHILISILLKIFGCLVVVVLFPWWPTRFEYSFTCRFPIWESTMQNVYCNCLSTFVLDRLFHWFVKVIYIVSVMFVLIILEDTETKINISIPSSRWYLCWGLAPSDIDCFSFPNKLLHLTTMEWSSYFANFSLSSLVGNLWFSVAFNGHVRVLPRTTLYISISKP